MVRVAGGKLPGACEQPGGEVLTGGGHGGTAQPFQVLAFALLPDPAHGAARKVPLAPLLGGAGERRRAEAGTSGRAAKVSARKATEEVFQLTHCPVQRRPAMRGILSRGFRACLAAGFGLGSRWASFSRSMVRPRWIRDRTVPSLTSSATATSS